MFILKGVKVLCFDTDLQVFILKVLIDLLLAGFYHVGCDHILKEKGRVAGI